MIRFFRSVHRKKELSHFDLNSWVTGGTKIRSNFLGQNDSTYSLRALGEKLSDWNLKNWFITVCIQINVIKKNNHLCVKYEYKKKIKD